MDELEIVGWVLFCIAVPSSVAFLYFVASTYYWLWDVERLRRNGEGNKLCHKLNIYL